MRVCGYGVLVEPISGRLPVFEVLEALYDHCDDFVILDCSKYDKIDLTRYGKVRKHVKSIFNCFDNPFGAAYSSAYHLVDADHSLFIDFDEIFEFKSSNLKDIIKRYSPLPDKAGIAFSLRNYYCSRNFVIDGCSSKGAHVFRTNPTLAHDSLQGYWRHRNRIRRTNDSPDANDGVRLCDENNVPINHFPPVSPDEVLIHHTSHLDLAGKVVRSILQYNHTSTLDLLEFFPFDMRLWPELVEKIYQLQVQEIKNGDIKLYAPPIPIEYEGNEHLDAFVKRINLPEFDPTQVADYKRFV